MPPKKASTAAKKSAGSAPAHASYVDMIKEGVINLKDRAGSSRQALKKYVRANNSLGDITDGTFTSQFNRALTRGSDTGVFARPKGPSGPVKLANPATKTSPSETKPAAKTTTKAPAKKAAAAAPTTTKKAPAKAAAKKAPTKKAATSTTKKAPAKKAAAAAPKSKANTSKVRKTPTAAPAVEDKAPVVLGKTKSGRVTKSKAPQPAKKAAATKRKAPAKKAAPKKAATPKSKA